MSDEIQIKFAADPTATLDAFRLLELPPELQKDIDSAKNGGHNVRLTIRGHPTDDAVLTSDSRTYDLRAVTLSNSLLILTPCHPAEFDISDSDASNTLVVRDSVQQILECIPTVPKLDRLDALLRNAIYDPDADTEDFIPDLDAAGPDVEMSDIPNPPSTSRRKFYTPTQISSLIQASPGELGAALQARRILTLDSHLRPIAPSYLTTVLSTLLNTLIARSLDPSRANVRAIQDELYDIQEIRREVTRQVLAWFGTLSGSDDKEIWSINHASIVREIGLGLLRPHTLTSSQTSPLLKTTFLSSWSEAVGDTFVSYISLSLLSGFYLLHPSPTFPDDSSQETISYYPATALPTAPTARFADLFLTRPKWRYEDLVPFLEGVAVDSKERDKLLIKYGRASTDKDGKIWYTAKTAMF